MPASPQPRTSRARRAPAYYLGRPASWWIAAATRRVRVPGHSRPGDPRADHPAGHWNDIHVPGARVMDPQAACRQAREAGLNPAVRGEQWGLGAVGTAAWTGVPLARVLDRAAPPPGAWELVFRGADRGQVEEREGPVAFERSLRRGRPEAARALLAYAMNGARLPAQHGFRLRLIVPGWYGVASVKWLTDIDLTARAFDGYFQVNRYHIAGEPLTGRSQPRQSRWNPHGYANNAVREVRISICPARLSRAA